jgi:hypothetical protein
MDEVFVDFMGKTFGQKIAAFKAVVGRVASPWRRLHQ